MNDPFTWLDSSQSPTSLISQLSNPPPAPTPTLTPTPDVKSYSDALYHNYYSLGISLVFAPSLSEQPPRLTSVDIHNFLPPPPPTTPPPVNSGTKTKRKPPSPYSAYPMYPLVIYPSSKTSLSTTTAFEIHPNSVGLDFVTALGEPERKGGGENGVGIWCEWKWENVDRGPGSGTRTGSGLMVEFASEGLGKWEKGAQAGWTVASFF